MRAIGCAKEFVEDGNGVTRSDFLLSVANLHIIIELVVGLELLKPMTGSKNQRSALLFASKTSALCNLQMS